MFSYLIIAIIIGYSGWIIYKTVKGKLKGDCNSCSRCSLSNSCSAKSLKENTQKLKLGTDYKSRKK